MAEKKSIGLRLAIGGAVIAIAVIVTLYIFVWKQPCDGINNEYLSCAWKGSAADWFGLLLFWNACFWLSGLYGFLIKDDDQDPWKSIVKYSFFGGIAGLLLIALL